jgi:hypothetical protein
MDRRQRKSGVEGADRRLKPTRPNPMHRTYSRRVPGPDQGWLSSWLTFYFGWPRPSRDWDE